MKLQILPIIFISIIPFYFAGAQTTDSINCDKFYEWLDADDDGTPMLINTPQPTETNRVIFCELCDIFAKDSVNIINEFQRGPKRIIVSLLLNENGNPVCDRIYPKNMSDSIKNEITKLIYKIVFNPKWSVFSQYTIIIDSQHCKIYRDVKNFEKYANQKLNMNKKRKNRLK